MHSEGGKQAQPVRNQGRAAARIVRDEQAQSALACDDGEHVEALRAHRRQRGPPWCAPVDQESHLLPDGPRHRIPIARGAAPGAYPAPAGPLPTGPSRSRRAAGRLPARGPRGAAGRPRQSRGRYPPRRRAALRGRVSPDAHRTAGRPAPCNTLHRRCWSKSPQCRPGTATLATAIEHRPRENFCQLTMRGEEVGFRHRPGVAANAICCRRASVRRASLLSETPSAVQASPSASGVEGCTSARRSRSPGPGPRSDQPAKKHAGRRDPYSIGRLKVLLPDWIYLPGRHVRKAQPKVAQRGRHVRVAPALYVPEMAAMDKDEDDRPWSG